MAQVKQSFLKDRRNAAMGAAALVALSLGVSDAQPAHAADFSHVKHVFVPPSRIPRRFDYESQGGGREATFYDAAPSAEYIPPVPSSGKPGKYGMVPPPPPVTPSLLPSSLKVPPPPPAPSIIRSTSDSSSSSSLGAPQRNSWSSTVQTTMDKSRTPGVNNVLDRAQQKVESLIQQGKLTEAQDLVKQYMLAFPKDKQLSSQMVRATVEKAKGLLEANDPEGAAKQAREALYIDGSNQAASTVLAQALTKSGSDPKSSAARIKAGESLSAQGRNAEAEVEYRAAVKIKSTAEAHIGLGNVLYKQGKRDLAKSEYQQALELNPDSPVALRQMGIVRLATNDVVGANANLTRALVIDPTDKVAGKSLLELWQRQVSRSPKDANAHLGLARAYQLTGDLKSAQASYRTVVHLDPNHPNLPAARHSFKLALARQEAIKSYEAAKTLDSHGATREAFDRMVEAVGLFPAEMNYRLYQAELAEKLGMIQQAHDYYVFILREDPKNAIAAQRLKALPAAGANGQPVAMHATAGSLSQLQAAAPSQLLEAPPAKTIAPPPVVLGAPVLGSSSPTAKMASDSNVNSIAGFLGQLRNFSLVQQQQIKTTEDNAHSAIKDLAAALSPTPPAAASSATASASGIDVPPISIPGLGTIPGIGGTASGATAAAPSALGSSAGTAASAADATTAPSMTGLALAPLLNGNDKAGLAALGAQAAPAIMSGKMAKLNQSDVDNVYSLLKGPISKKLGIKTAPPQAVNSSSDVPPTAPAVASAFTVTPDQMQMAMQRLGNLEARNNELQAQLAQAHQAIKDLKSSTPNFMMGPAPTTPTPGFMTGSDSATATTASAAAASSSTPFMAGGFATASTPASTSVPKPFMAGGFATASTPASTSTPKPFMAGGFANSATPASSTTPANSALSSAPTAESKIFVPGSSANALTPGVAQPVFQTETPRYATPSELPEPAPTPSAPATPPNLSGKNNLQSALPAGAVKLELEGVNASMTDIKLKVILRNEQNEILTIPSSAQAIVRMTGRPDRKAKVTFPSASIPAHGEVRGIIKVSGHDLNPSADVFIPITTASGSNEIHLTVPISSL